MIFQPTLPKIEHTASVLNQLVPKIEKESTHEDFPYGRRVEVVINHGRMAIEDQVAAVKSDPSCFKIVVISGIGDSSITPENCLIGADSGLKGASLFVPEQRVEVVTCFQSLPQIHGRQRTGRTGRMDLHVGVEVADALDMDHVNGKLVTPVAVMLDFVCHAEALRRDPYPVFDPKAVEFSDHLLALKGQADPLLNLLKGNDSQVWQSPKMAILQNPFPLNHRKQKKSLLEPRARQWWSSVMWFWMQMRSYWAWEWQHGFVHNGGRGVRRWKWWKFSSRKVKKGDEVEVRFILWVYCTQKISKKSKSIQL